MLNDFYDKIRAIQEFDIAKEAAEIINTSQEYLTGLLKDQLARGVDGDGEAVSVFDRTFYSEETLAKKKYQDGLAGETRWITNYMSGSFYANLNVKAEGNEFTFSSEVPYLDEILYQSGDRILILNADHCKQFSEEVLMPRLQEAFELKVAGF